MLITVEKKYTNRNLSETDYSVRLADGAKKQLKKLAFVSAGATAVLGLIVIGPYKNDKKTPEPTKSD